MHRLVLIIMMILCNRPAIFSQDIVVCTAAINKDYINVVLSCIKNKEDYCIKNKYKYHFVFDSLDESRHPAWSKIILVHKLLTEGHEWVFWTDADSLIMNSDIELSKFTDYNYDMIVASDFNAINTGQFFMRNCPWSRDFLERVYNRTEFINHPWWEQMAIIDELEKHPEDKRHVKVLPQREMNSYAEEVYGRDQPFIYQEGDFIIHFAGVRARKLTTLIDKYYQLAK